MFLEFWIKSIIDMFSIGQLVVCKDNNPSKHGYPSGIVVGCIYKIKDIYECEKCGDVLLILHGFSDYSISCRVCGEELPYRGFSSVRFEPLIINMVHEFETNEEHIRELI